MVESRKSTIDSEWTVFIFDEADDSSPKLLFEVYGVAFADLKSKSIFIDDTAVLSQNQILAIEAHEIAHGRLDHENRDIDQITQEKEADWLAHKILTEMSLVTPAQIISDRYSNHYGEDISSQNERMFTILGTVLIK
jgi:hypothetical protein